MLYQSQTNVASWKTYNSILTNPKLQKTIPTKGASQTRDDERQIKQESRKAKDVSTLEKMGLPF